MANFLFTTRDGKTVEDDFPCGQAPKYIVLHDGTIAKRDREAEIDVSAELTRGSGTGIYPLLSDALGVHPDQRQEAYEHSVKHGCATSFVEDGRAEIRNEKHHNALKRSIGCYDRNAGYSGVTPQ